MIERPWESEFVAKFCLGSQSLRLKSDDQSLGQLAEVDRSSEVKRIRLGEVVRVKRDVFSDADSGGVDV